MTLTMTSGMEIQVDWIGVSMSDRLYLETKTSFIDCVTIFGDKDETAVMVASDEDSLYRYEGYTKLMGVQIMPNPEIVQVCLVKEGYNG